MSWSLSYVLHWEGILNRIGLKVNGNVFSFRRLDKSMSQRVERRKCTPLINTCEGPLFYLDVLQEISNCMTTNIRFILRSFFPRPKVKSERKLFKNGMTWKNKWNKNKSDIRMKELKLCYKATLFLPWR